MSLWTMDDNEGSKRRWIANSTNYTTSSVVVHDHDNGAHQLPGNTAAIFGVDSTETGVANDAGMGIAHGGWVKKITKGSRVQYETLVASGSITGDAADDSTFADS